MAINYNPKIVTNNLVLCLDAANSKSYPGSGTVWTDLSGNGNHGTLTNGPTFSSDNKGSIVFDGVNDYISIPSNYSWRMISSSTICFWSNLSSSAGYTIAYNKGGWEGYLLTAKSATYSGQAGSNDFDYSGSATLNTWYFSTFVVNRESGFYYFYRNGTLLSSGAITHPGQPSQGILYIGARGGVPDNFASMKFSTLGFYTKALSAAEIKQNFEATRGRYGI